MAVYFLYRVSSGEVSGATNDPANYAGVGPYLAVTPADPPTPDGGDLGVKKIYIGGTVRNATPQEIEGFPAFVAEDENLQQREAAVVLFNGGDSVGKVSKGLALVTMDELNAVRQWIVSFKSAVAAASNLTDLKTRVATLPNMPDRTASQIKPAVVAKIQGGGDAD